jgi:hypothetical protein
MRLVNRHTSYGREPRYVNTSISIALYNLWTILWKTAFLLVALTSMAYNMVTGVIAGSARIATHCFSLWRR